MSDRCRRSMQRERRGERVDYSPGAQLRKHLHREVMGRLQFASAIPIFNPDVGTVPSLDSEFCRVL